MDNTFFVNGVLLYWRLLDEGIGLRIPLLLGINSLDLKFLFPLLQMLV